MFCLKERHIDFYTYFTQYAASKEQWATCYRIGTIVNTNMYVESFHRLLKVVYLNSKQNHRVDRLIYVILRIARNLVYEQLQKAQVGKITHRKSEIYKRHKLAMALQDHSTR